MAKVSVTLEFEESILQGLDEAVKRDELKYDVIVDGQPVRKQIYASGRELLARRIIRDGLMNLGHMIPVIVEKKSSIMDEQRAIEALLTPTVKERSPGEEVKE
jgi:hypothetical protein